MKDQAKEILELAELAEKEKTDGDLEKDLRKKLARLSQEFEKLEFFVLFSDKYDSHNAIVSIHAGAGGTEAQDWAQMLERMILRYCENKKFKTVIADQAVGSEAGIKSVTFRVEGKYSFGYLKSEAGVHRLVRMSPFDAEKMRHTSFALIEVLPELAETDETKIDPNDLRIDTFISSGPGGQGMQRSYSAVRITHLPTKTVVTCQNERSQVQNKATAMKILQSRLQQLQQFEQEKEKKKIRGEYLSAQWGNQIRSYVLHPYKMVKDHRTDFEVKEPDVVLDGGVDGFVEAYLRWVKRSGKFKVSKSKVQSSKSKVSAKG